MCASQVTFSLYALEKALADRVAHEVGAESSVQAQSFTLRMGLPGSHKLKVIPREVTVGSSERVEGFYPDEA
eukprot:1524673-Pyramimonas_sp.AAC.1